MCNERAACFDATLAAVLLMVLSSVVVSGGGGAGASVGAAYHGAIVWACAVAIARGAVPRPWQTRRSSTSPAGGADRCRFLAAIPPPSRPARPCRRRGSCPVFFGVV